MAAQGYKLLIEQPANAKQRAKQWDFGGGEGRVVRIDCALHANPERVATLTAQIYDKGWATFGELPDPAFQKVPVKLYLCKAGEPTSAAVLAFSGVLTELNPSYPVEMLTLTANDKSVEARRRARWRTLKNKTSVQLVKSIAKEYDFDVDVYIDDAEVELKKIDMGAGLSDWDQMVRALRADGLQMYVKGDRLRIQRIANVDYATKFRKGDERIIALDVSVRHVGVPGSGGDRQLIPLETGETVRIVTNDSLPATWPLYTQDVALWTVDRSASKVVDKMPPTGPLASTSGSHSEDRGKPFSGRGYSDRRRKDVLRLETTALPDLEPKHRITLEGCGAKADGVWFVESITHAVASDVYARTTTTAKRATGAAKQTGLPTVAFDA